MPFGLHVGLLKPEVASLEMAATQAAIIQGSAASSMPRCHGPFGAGNGLGGSYTTDAPTRTSPGMTGTGKSPCHCRHLDIFKDRGGASEARLAEADKFCDMLKVRLDEAQASRGKFTKDGVSNPCTIAATLFRSTR